MTEIGDEYEVKLINAIESISTDNLKRTSHGKCIDHIVQISKQALKLDGTRLLLLIESIKSSRQACYKRDLLLDVLEALIVSNDVLIDCLLCRPFPSGSYQIPWKELANAIATIPDLAANCEAQSRIPLFNRCEFQHHLLEAMYESFVFMSAETMTEEHKMFLLQIVGRIALTDGDIHVWTLLTSRAIQDTRLEVKSVVSSLFQVAVTMDPSYSSFELFMERLFLHIFYSLKPSKQSSDQIYALLGNGALVNDHLRYLICDKSIFKTNYKMDKLRLSISLFNISAYLAGLVSHENTFMKQKTGNKCSLLMQTFLETLRQWASATKALLRTYEQSRHITASLLVTFRYALEYDRTSLGERANEIQSMLVSALPMYLNRASREQRDLAMCLGKLLLPKLRELLTHANAVDSCELDINYDIGHTDDLLYLQRLFKHDIEIIFQDIPDQIDSRVHGANSGSPIKARSDGNRRSSARLPVPAPPSSSQSRVAGLLKSEGERQLRMKKTSDGTDTSNVTAASTRVRPIVSELNVDCKNALIGSNGDDQSMANDPKPHSSSNSDADDDANVDDDDDDDEYELGADPLDVPIYLQDCINGLVENNNYRYVRLCLMKAGALIDQLIIQDAQTRDRQLLPGLSNRQMIESTRVVGSQAARSELVAQSARDTVHAINATIKDVGVELARTLLFLDNQFNIKGFEAFRLKALTSLCVAAPQLVGKYLLEEFNGTNKSMPQQLHILRILTDSAVRLSGAMSKNVATTTTTTSRKEPCRTNRFAAHAALYLYGIVYRLKADFMDNKSLVITQPKSILSAFRELKCRGSSDDEVEQSRGKNDIDRNCDADRDVDRLLERNSLSDDSYLLSHIMLATANIINCASQQPIVCKLSSDLLDILAAYRCHPDSGVQEAMIANLAAIRKSTPRVYYENFIESRMVQMFGPWLARMEQP